MSGSGVLPCCRYLSAESVSIAASDEVEAGQTFAAALPHLTVGAPALSSKPKLGLVGGCFHGKGAMLAMLVPDGRSSSTAGGTSISIKGCCLAVARLGRV
jgi:hypothetical protein